MKIEGKKNILYEQKIRITNCNCIDSSEISIKASTMVSLVTTQNIRKILLKWIMKHTII